MDSRTQLGIVMDRFPDNGSARVWLIPSRQYVIRDIFYKAHMNDLTKDWLNSVASEDDTSFGLTSPMQTRRQRLLQISGDRQEEDAVHSEVDTSSSSDVDSEDDDDDVSLPPDVPDSTPISPDNVVLQQILPSVPDVPVPDVPDVPVPDVPEETVPDAPASEVRSSARRKGLLDFVSAFAGNMTVKQAMEINPEWTMIGVNKEIESLLKKKVLVFVDPATISFTDYHRAIPCKLFIKEKQDAMKARMVAGGHRQEQLPTEETNSPTVMNVSLMALIQIITTNNLNVCVADVETAYLNARNTSNDLMYISAKDSQHFVRAQPHLAVYLDKQGCLVCKIVKALYGLQQSAKLWYDHLSSTLHTLKYKPIMEDRCAFIKVVDGKTYGDIKSHSGIIYSLTATGPAISCFSLKQKIIAQSTTEAELIALHEGAKSTVWMASLISQLGAVFSTPIIFQDNEATIRLAAIGGPGSTATKHIQMRFFTVKEYVDAGLLKIEHRRTDKMIADILTKPIIGPHFEELRTMLLNM